MLLLSSMIRGEIIEYLDTGRFLFRASRTKTSCSRSPDPRSSTGRWRTNSDVLSNNGQALADGDPRPARFSTARAWGRRPVKVTVDEPNAVEPGLLPFAVFVVRETARRRQRGRSSATTPWASASQIAVVVQGAKLAP